MARNKGNFGLDDLIYQNVSKKSEESKDNVVSKPAKNTASGTEINSSLIVPSPFNEGLDSERIEEYVRSMKEIGMLEPIVVYEMPNGKYEILSGHQRFQAWCVELKHDTISAVILPYEKDPIKRFTAHTEANTLTRNKDLKFWLSRIKHARQVLKDSGFHGGKIEENKEVSRMLGGLSQQQLYRYESFEKLIPALQSLEGRGVLSANTLYGAVSLSDRQQEEVYHQVELLIEKKKAMTPSQSELVDITREEFNRIVQNVKLEKAVWKEPVKRRVYAERMDDAARHLLKTISSAKDGMERQEGLKLIEKLRRELDDIEKNLR